jgi:hypothetical protein
MTLSLSAKKNLFLSPPRAAGIGQVLAVSVSSTASYVNLGALFQPAAGGQSGAQTQGSSGVVVGVLDNYISIYADGAELGVVFGLTAAAVSGANAPALATAGSLLAGVYTPPATPACWGIATGTWQRFLAQLTQDLFMGFVASGAGTMRLYQSSPPNP